MNVTMPCARIGSITVDAARIPAQMKDELAVWALTAKLSNTYASMSEEKGFDVSDWRKKADELIDEAYAGQISFGGGGGGKALDPFEKECRLAFIAWVQKASKRQPKAADLAKMSTTWEEQVADLYAKAGKTDQAAARIAAIKDAAQKALDAKDAQDTDIEI